MSVLREKREKKREERRFILYIRDCNMKYNLQNKIYQHKIKRSQNYQELKEDIEELIMLGLKIKKFG